MLDPKDCLNYRLTGVAGGDSVTASRVDVPWTAPVGLPATLLRAVELLQLPCCAPWQQLGTVRQ